MLPLKSVLFFSRGVVDDCMGLVGGCGGGGGGGRGHEGRGRVTIEREISTFKNQHSNLSKWSWEKVLKF